MLTSKTFRVPMFFFATLVLSACGSTGSGVQTAASGTPLVTTTSALFDRVYGKSAATKRAVIDKFGSMSLASWERVTTRLTQRTMMIDGVRVKLTKADFDLGTGASLSDQPATLKEAWAQSGIDLSQASLDDFKFLVAEFKAAAGSAALAGPLDHHIEDIEGQAPAPAGDSHGETGSFSWDFANGRSVCFYQYSSGPRRGQIRKCTPEELATVRAASGSHTTAPKRARVLTEFEIAAAASDQPS